MEERLVLISSVPYLSLGVEYMDILCSSLAAVAPKLITAIAGYDVKKSRTNENKIQICH